VPQLLAQAEGNPFFLEELARTVVEQGANAASLTVPTTVQAVLMARIDRLPATAKRLLQVAAVMGKEVALPLLQAVTEVPEESLHDDLKSLQAAEFLYETYGRTAPVYTFKHALTQEVAYHSLVRHVRQHYHGRIAQVLEAQFPEVAESQPELLAYHYTEAERGAQAIPYWHRAGQRAVERSANSEAVTHFTQGLELLQSLPATPERARQELALQLALGISLRMVKGHTALELENLYTRAYELSQQVGESQQQFLALESLWRLSINRAKISQACELAEQCVALAQHGDDPGLLQEAYRMLGESLFFQGQPVLARTYLEQGVALYDAQQGRVRAFSSGIEPGVICLCFLAATLWQLGYPEQALTRSHEALTQAQESSHAFSLGFALNYASLLHVWRREVQCAKERADAVITLANEHEFIQPLSVGMIRRGWALAQQGAVAEGIRQLQQGLATLRNVGQELPLSHHLALLAEAYRQGGQVEAGLQALAEAFAHLDNTGERYYEAELHRLKGEFLLAQPDKRCQEREAEECFHQALAIARRQLAKALELRTALSLSHLWQQQGQRQEAYDLLAPVYGWFTEGLDTADLQEAKALLAALT
jgi:predicted ATPase